MLWKNISGWMHQRFNVPYQLNVQYDEGVGLPIVFLHGIASNASAWRSTMSLVSPTYRCIAMDLLGFGHSPKPLQSSYSIDQHVACIHRTIHSLKLRGPFILVGHSMGGLIAAHYARRYPNEVKRLLMLSPPIMTHMSPDKKSRLALSSGAYARAYKYLREHKKFTLIGVQRMRQLLRTSPFTLTEDMWLPFVRSLEECIEKQTAIGDELAHIVCPIDIFYGTRDKVINLANVLSLAAIPNITLHQFNGWHRINLRYAQTVADYLLLGYGFSI